MIMNVDFGILVHIFSYDVRLLVILYRTHREQIPKRYYTIELMEYCIMHAPEWVPEIFKHVRTRLTEIDYINCFELSMDANDVSLVQLFFKHEYFEHDMSCIYEHIASAIQEFRNDVVEYMCNLPSIDCLYNQGDLFIMAMMYNNTYIFDTLIEKEYVNVDNVWYFPIEILIFAIEHSRYTCLSILLELDCVQPHTDDNIAFHTALSCGDLKIMQMLYNLPSVHNTLHLSNLNRDYLNELMS